MANNTVLRGEYYPLHVRCTYEVYKATTLGCPGLQHIRHCEQYECPHMFKCTTSYCIPTYLWCDQVEHCPNGEDEVSCIRQNCPGLLRCRHDNVCVHPLNICDGHAQCLLFRDDERFCSIGTCPKMCKCQGSAMICREAHLKVADIPTNIMTCIKHKS